VGGGGPPAGEPATVRASGRSPNRVETASAAGAGPRTVGWSGARIPAGGTRFGETASNGTGIVAANIAVGAVQTDRNRPGYNPGAAPFPSLIGDPISARPRKPRRPSWRSGPARTPRIRYPSPTGGLRGSARDPSARTSSTDVQPHASRGASADPPPRTWREHSPTPRGARRSGRSRSAR